MSAKDLVVGKIEQLTEEPINANYVHVFGYSKDLPPPTLTYSESPREIELKEEVRMYKELLGFSQKNLAMSERSKNEYSRKFNSCLEKLSDADCAFQEILKYNSLESITEICHQIRLRLTESI